MSETAKIIIANKTVEYPIIVGTEGEKAIDISKLRADTGCITLDNGLMNSGSCKSAVTFLDGEKGVLRYRGYSIDELAEKAIFREVAYLLIYGELPNKPQFKQFCDRVHKYSTLPEGVYKILDQYPLDAHPMAVASSVLAGLSAFYPEYLQSDLNPQQKDEVIAQIFAQFKLIISYFYRRTKGNTTRVPTQQDQTYAGDFINMMFHKPGFTIDPEISRALDILLILHADHEQNCSTSTVRVVGSSKANVFAAVSAGIDALWGQLHGGANQAVLEMLEEVRQDGWDVTKAIAKAKDKNSGFRLMGFGHRVYK
ncbi:MAG: citrate/2-methylcitrate synthase, partial [Bdellovibrionota bacterium]